MEDFNAEEELKKVEEEAKVVIMRNGVIIKKDGVVTVKSIRPEAVPIASNRARCVKHICGTCANLDPKKCQKVFDREEQDIREYDFIKNGIEVFNDKGTIVNFIVNSCDCYKPEITREKPKSMEEVQRIEREVRNRRYAALLNQVEFKGRTK